MCIVPSFLGGGGQNAVSPRSATNELPNRHLRSLVARHGARFVSLIYVRSSQCDCGCPWTTVSWRFLLNERTQKHSLSLSLSVSLRHSQTQLHVSNRPRLVGQEWIVRPSAGAVGALIVVAVRVSARGRWLKKKKTSADRQTNQPTNQPTNQERGKGRERKAKKPTKREDDGRKTQERQIRLCGHQTAQNIMSRFPSTKSEDS